MWNFLKYPLLAYYFKKYQRWIVIGFATFVGLLLVNYIFADIRQYFLDTDQKAMLFFVMLGKWLARLLVIAIAGSVLWRYAAKVPVQISPQKSIQTDSPINDQKPKVKSSINDVPEHIRSAPKLRSQSDFIIEEAKK